MKITHGPRPAEYSAKKDKIPSQLYINQKNKTQKPKPKKKDRQNSIKTSRT